MQPINDDRYPQLSERQQLDLACSIINNMLRNYLGACGNKEIKPLTLSILLGADLLGVYSGDFTGSGMQLRDEWDTTRRDFPEYKVPIINVPKKDAINDR